MALGRVSELNRIRFSNRDLSNFGALAHGPFGSVRTLLKLLLLSIDSEAKVDMVRCKLDQKLYVRKSVEKRVVTRNPSVRFLYVWISHFDSSIAMLSLS